MSQTKPTLVYIGDPMCSWCYGFSPEFSKVMEELGDQVDLEIIMGGLRPYNTETMIEMKDFLQSHWEDVNARSGQPFSYDILEKDYIYDTEPPSRAVVIVRELAPDKTWQFFKKIQEIFYYKNENTNELATYLPLLEELDIDIDQFKKRYESDAMKEKVREDFITAGEMGVRGFPTVMLEKDGQYYLIANGYTTADKIVKAVQNNLK